ncbi:MAG: hypothetical protein ABI282_00205 [Candidatus Baltobacteraceae bacterium]
MTATIAKRMLAGTPSKRPFQIPLQDIEGRLGRLGSCNDQKTNPAPFKQIVQNCPDSPANPVPHDGFSDRLADRDSRRRSRIARVAIGPVDGQDAARNPFASVT